MKTLWKIKVTFFMTNEILYLSQTKGKK